MADVNGSVPSREPAGSGAIADRTDRAQLFLVGAIVLAVLFLALAALLNSVIYTGNLATRDSGSDVAATIEYDDAAHDAIEVVLAETNDYSEGTDVAHDELWTEFSEGIDAWESASAEHAAIRGTMVSIENVTITNGTRIQHNSTTGENFYPVDDNTTTEWTLADSTRVRKYTIEAEPTNGTAATLNDTDPVNVTETFFIEFTGNETYYLHLYRTSSGDGCALVHDGTDGVERECVSDSEFHVNLTGDSTNSNITIAPASAPGSTEAFDVSLFESVGPGHEITYHNPGTMNGTYTLTISSTTGDAGMDANRFNEDPNASGSPTADDAIYDVEYDVIRRSKAVRYRNGTRIAPEEAPYNAS
ncbi:hypothetical protein ACERIT_07725 [Halopenitus sp. H-Gu1]|uniref:DUF7261 family protein n=1 Tax=Halopenitus sp. H-Gu1 TaxID=3242697 RepID=UPI00359F06E5